MVFWHIKHSTVKLFLNKAFTSLDVVAMRAEGDAMIER